MFSAEYDYHSLQKQYFVIDSFASLRDIGSELESALHRHQDKLAPSVSLARGRVPAGVVSHVE